MVEAYQRADLEAVAERCADDFEFASVMSEVEESSYRGRHAWTAYWADMREAWEEWR